MSHFVHPLGVCESTQIGNGTRIWAFAHVLPGAHIGQDCNLCDHVFVENDVEIGDRVTVKSGVQLWNGMRIEDDVLVTKTGYRILSEKIPRERAAVEQWLAAARK